ncbi:hypothetical protein ACVWXQ_007205 [Bradyrhizobium sp. S3.14.4]
MSEPSPNNPAPAEDAESEPRPGRVREPIGWSTIIIAVLVAVSAGLVWRRDGTDGVLEILTHDLSLFGGILPRVLAGCLLGAFISEILPHEKVSRSLGPKSGLMGLLIGTAFGVRSCRADPSPPILWRARCSPSAPISAPPSPWS